MAIKCVHSTYIHILVRNAITYFCLESQKDLLRKYVSSITSKKMS